MVSSDVHSHGERQANGFGLMGLLSWFVVAVYRYNSVNNPCCCHVCTVHSNGPQLSGSVIVVVVVVVVVVDRLSLV